MEQSTYLALGDSYTIGEGVKPAEAWPAQLAIQLTQQGFPTELEQTIATTGWTTDELQKAIKQADPYNNYQLVSLLIGVNNQYRGYDEAVYRHEFEALLQQAIYFANKKTEGVFVLSIPDWGVTPYAEGKDRKQIAREIDLYNSIAQEICHRQGIAFYNITELTRQHPTWVVGDNLHPSASMYSAWVSLIQPYVVKQVKLLKKLYS
jgi:lysophospholipase L1-like esterase